MPFSFSQRCQETVRLSTAIWHYVSGRTHGSEVLASFRGPVAGPVTPRCIGQLGSRLRLALDPDSIFSFFIFPPISIFSGSGRIRIGGAPMGTLSHFG